LSDARIQIFRQELRNLYFCFTDSHAKSKLKHSYQMLIRQATHIDISGILELQVANLFSNLSPLERKKGFVTTPFTRELIEKIILQKGLLSH